MTMLFMFCALGGGTILICQFVLLLVGMGDDGHHGCDVDHSCDVDHDAPGDVSTDLGGGHGGGDVGHAHEGHGSTWLFGVISFRTLVAAAAFFGLTGMAAQTSKLSVPFQLLIAVVCGVAAMYGVHWMMRSFRRLSQDGTLQIRRAVGITGTVYVPVPAARGGTGKVQLNVQNRLTEFEAVTSEKQKLPTGARVIVVSVVNPTTLEVEAVRETADTADVVAS